MSKLTVFEAISEMRELSKKGQAFAFSFMSYNRTNQSTHGVVEVRNGQLKRRTKEADYNNAELIEEYVDLDTHEHRKFYQCTLMTFNGKKLQLL